jgi:hypothetical protein
MSPTFSSRRVACLAAALLPLASIAQSTDEMNASNNPLTPSIGANLQDSYVGRSYGLADEDSNALLLRGTVPHKLFGQPQILRATLPVVTTLDIPPDGRQTNVGDLNLFDLFLFRSGHVELGIGPQLTLPTAGQNETGSGKWQAGLAGVVIAPQRWGMIGGLLTWQQSFAGDDDRKDLNTLQAQPFLIYNLPQAWYLRSTATASFDLRSGDYYIPLGAGVGKIWKDGKTTYNLFAEPQWTVAHDGDGVPKFQIFFGLNMQFPL